LTAQIYLPVNEPYHKEFSDCIKIGIRTNDREKAAVTVEAYKKGAKSGLGKWPTVMQEELGVSLPPKSRPDMSNYERCVEKINTYLSWFKMIYENPKSDYIIGKIASSGGYPLANKETGETKLITAPIIKIS
jgi:hypothetical protein